jgi:hypothetical protein
MGLSKETRVALNFMSHRVYYCLQRELLKEPGIRPEFVRILSTANGASEVEFKSRALFLELLNSKASDQVADRIFRPLPDAIWVQLVDDLLSNERCTLNYFGRLDVKEERGRPIVSFQPVSSFVEGVPPFTESSDDKLEAAQMSLCQEALQNATVHLQLTTMTSLAEAYATASQAFRSALPDIVNALRPLSNNANRAIEQDPFLFVPRALGHAAYYLSLWSVSQALQKTDRLSIKPIGELRRSGERLTFAADPQLLGMLSALAHH